MLQSKFDIAYKEWKEYKDFFLSDLEKQNRAVKENMADLVGDLGNDDKILQFFYDTRVYPKMYEADFNLLSLKLITIYDAVRDSVEIPEDAQKEIDGLLTGYKSTQRFVIKSGKAEPINEDLIERTKEQFKKTVKDKELFKDIQGLIKDNGQ